MLKQNILVAAGKSVFIDVIGDALYFPIWWYSAGLKHVARNRVKNIVDTADHLALRLLVLNIFKPMFAQYDREGRIISFFMRIVILVARLIYFVVYVTLQFLLLVAWLVIPLLVFYRLIVIYFAV